MRVVILLIVILAVFVMVENIDGDAERIAMMPIKVWKVVPEYTCLIYPGQAYTVTVPMYPDLEKHPDSHGWYNVRSAKCSGVALVGSGR